MARKDCPKCGHKLYPLSVAGRVVKEDKRRTNADGRHPLIVVNGKVTWLNCRHCGHKETKPINNNSVLDKVRNVVNAG